MKDEAVARLFDNILEKGEVILRTYKPDRKALRTEWFFWFWVIPLLWPVFILLLPIMWPVFRAYYNKRAYAVTDRRILVRGGIVGTDYKSLKISAINATTARVGLMDKIAKQNTGTIEFGSPATPLGVTNTSGVRVNPFIFGRIINPYEELREIEEHIDTVQKTA